jgi:glycosyltransferase involved in cell wall biosynthesis
MQTTLALCIPAYNATAHLPRLFESVRLQTVPFDEVWVYDDASTDDTAEVAERLGARVVRGGVNRGCSAGKNALLERVGAAWVHFHDADDTLAPEFVARARQRIEAGDFDVLLFDYEQVDESTGARMSRSDFRASDLLRDPVRYMLANTVNNGGVYSVGLLRQTGGFDLDPAVRYNEDRAFHLRLAEAGARFAVEPYVGSRFYFNPNSMSASNRARCCLASHEITLRFANRHPGRYRDEVAHLAWQNAACLASCLEWPGADACVALACETTGRLPKAASPLFKLLCFINPYWAIRIREGLIRLLKPRYRDGYPEWRANHAFSSTGGKT